MNKVSRSLLLRFEDGAAIKNYRLLTKPGTVQDPHSDLVPLGEGGSGVVYLAAQTLHENIEVRRAIKFFMYRDDIADLTAHGTPVSKDDFLAEVVNIASLSHENLTKVIDAGMHSVEGIAIPYLVTEYVHGPTLREVIERKWKPDSNARSFMNNPAEILDILIQIGLAIQHLHARGFSHCDIAPKNIFLNEEENLKPVLGDLGLAKNINRPRQEILMAGTRAYMPPICLEHLNKAVTWSTFSATYPLWDIWAFAQTGIELLGLIDGENPPAWRRALVTCFEQSKRGERYCSVVQLIERLKFLRPVHREVAAVPELSASISGKLRKLMPVQPLITSPRVRQLIQHPALLRLARVPQLSTTLIAFPAATHTRYEHSLGVMETMRRYLVALLDQEEFLEHLNAEKIEIALICALFSNLTRFPMSNVLHEIKHQNESMLTPFKKESLLKDVFDMRDNKDRSLSELLSIGFPSVQLSNVERILLARKSEFDHEDHVIFSFLNSSLDARVIDYVRRDSLHLGINEGSAVDLDELLPHLTVSNHKLALRMTGVTVAEQIISLRYWLFTRIYWCRPNRAFVAMVRFLMMELLADESTVQRVRKEALNVDQREFLRLLHKEAEKCGRSDLIDLAALLIRDQQNLYRVIFDVSPAEAQLLRPAWKQLDSMTHQELKLLGQNLSAEVLPSGDRGTALGVLALIVDLPQEPGATKLGDDIMVIGRDEHPVGLTDTSGIVRGVNESFNNHLRRLRVFLHPKLMPDSKAEKKRIEEAIKQYFVRHLT